MSADVSGMTRSAGIQACLAVVLGPAKEEFAESNGQINEATVF